MLVCHRGLRAPQSTLCCLLPFLCVSSQPFVLSLDDIEHVHFERVHFSSKSFDMVVIMKPGTTPKGQDEFSRISAIPMQKLDTVKMWLVDVLGKVCLHSSLPLSLLLSLLMSWLLSLLRLRLWLLLRCCCCCCCCCCDCTSHCRCSCSCSCSCSCCYHCRYCFIVAAAAAAAASCPCSCSCVHRVLCWALCWVQGYTEGVHPLNWKQFLKDYARKPEFYLDTDPETGEKKDIGWEALAGGDDEEQDEEMEEESEYTEDDDDDDEDEEEDSDVSARGAVCGTTVVAPLWLL